MELRYVYVFLFSFLMMNSCTLVPDKIQDSVSCDKSVLYFDFGKGIKSGAYLSGDDCISYVDIFVFQSGTGLFDGSVRRCTDLRNVKLEVSRGLTLNVYVVANSVLSSLENISEMAESDLLENLISYEENFPAPVMAKRFMNLSFDYESDILFVDFDRLFCSLEVESVDCTYLIEETGHSYDIRMFIANSSSDYTLGGFFVPSSFISSGTVLSTEEDPSSLSGVLSSGLVSGTLDGHENWMRISSPGKHVFRDLYGVQDFYFYPVPYGESVTLVIEFSREDGSYSVRYPISLSGLSPNKRYVIQTLNITTEHLGEGFIDFTISMDGYESEDIIVEI